MKKQRSFTLIELLVVMAIIALLSSIVLVSLNAVRGKARLAAAQQFEASVSHALLVYAVGVWDFSKGEGDIAEDVSGFGNRVIINGASWTEDTPTDQGYALSFDGNDYCAIENLYYDSPGAISEITVCAWFKTSYSGGNWKSNLAFVDFDRTKYFSFFIRGDNGKLVFSTTDEEGDSDHFVGEQVVNDGNWHFGCAVYDRKDKIIYIDGKEDSRKENPHNGKALGTGDIRYGFIGDGSKATDFDGNRTKRYYQGFIDGVDLYEYGLTSAQINKLYAKTSNVQL